LSKTDNKPMQWMLTDHCCRICFGRILTRTTFENRKVYKCSNCDAEVQAESVTGICCCGMKIMKQKDAGIRCVLNTDRKPENQSMVVAAQVVIPAR